MKRTYVKKVEPKEEPKAEAAKQKKVPSWTTIPEEP